VARERRRELDQENNSPSTTARGQTIYVSWPRPSRNSAPSGLSVDCQQRNLRPKPFAKPYQTSPNTNRLSHVHDVGDFFISIPAIISLQGTRTPSEDERISLLHKTIMRWIKSKLANYWLLLWNFQPNLFSLLSPSSPAHIHMWITLTWTVDCKHSELGSLLNKWTWIWTLRKNFRHALEVCNEAAENERIRVSRVSRVGEHSCKPLFVYRLLLETATQCFRFSAISVFFFP